MKKLWVVLWTTGFLPATASAQFAMGDYWLMAQGQYVPLHTRYRKTFQEESNRERCAGRVDHQAPHAMWRGRLLDRFVALQGGLFDDPAATYDIFEVEESPGDIYYWGTFRGNDYKPADEDQLSHAFSNRVLWMRKYMQPGDEICGSATSHEMSSNRRALGQVGQWGYSIRVEPYLDDEASQPSGGPYTIPETANLPNPIRYEDVIRVTYHQGTDQNHTFENHPCGAFKEEYWLAKGYGTIRFRSHDEDEPSCIDTQYAVQGPSWLSYGQPITATVPWYDPFGWQGDLTAFAPNGRFEVPDSGSSLPKSWIGYSAPGEPEEDVVRTGEYRWDGAYSIALRRLPTSGWDAAYSEAIPVRAGSYLLSGFLFRGSTEDDVYLDVLDANGHVDLGGNINAVSVGEWEYVDGVVDVGSADAIKVRCVRDNGSQPNGGNAANAYCDGITLQRIGVVTADPVSSRRGASCPFQTSTVTLAAPAPFREGVGAVSVDATLTTSDNQPLVDKVTVFYRTLDGTATAPADFAAPGAGSTSSIVFDPQSGSPTTLRVSIPIKDDLVAEPQEHFTFAASRIPGFPAATQTSSNCTTLANHILELTVLDDDIHVAFVPTEIRVPEAAPNPTRVVVRASTSNGSALPFDLSVPFFRNDLTTQGSEDVTSVPAAPGIIALHSGAAAAELAFTVNDDEHAEADEQVEYRLGTSDLYVLSGPTLTVTIEGNDPSPPMGFYPVPACRAFDSRSGSALRGGESVEIPIRGVCGVANTARAAQFGLIAVQPTSQGHLVVHGAGTARPTTSAVNFIAGVTTSGPGVFQLGRGGRIIVVPLLAAGGETHVVVDVLGYFQ